MDFAKHVSWWFVLKKKGKKKRKIVFFLFLDFNGAEGNFIGGVTYAFLFSVLSK